MRYCFNSLLLTRSGYAVVVEAALKKHNNKMKFVLVILFASMGDIYYFTDPSFDTKEECVTFLRDNSTAVFQKVMMEYGYTKEITAINCIKEMDFQNIINGQTIS